MTTFPPTENVPVPDEDTLDRLRREGIAFRQDIERRAKPMFRSSDTDPRMLLLRVTRLEAQLYTCKEAAEDRSEERLQRGDYAWSEAYEAITKLLTGKD